MSKFWLITVVCLLIVLVGCGLNVTRNIVPVVETGVTMLPRTKGLAASRDGVSLIVLPLQDVKELDGFGVVVVNETPNWVSFKKEDFILIQDGKGRRPLTDNQVNNRLGSAYKPKLPDEINVDIFEWRRDVNVITTRDLNIIDEDKKISVMSGTKDKFFIYFTTLDSIAPMQLIISNIYNETTKQRTRFSFKFTIEKK